MGRHTLSPIVLSVVSTPFLNANTAKPKIIDDGTVIKNVIVISPERSRAPPNAVVVIRGGRIAEIGTNFLPTHRGARSISQLAEGSKISRQAITKVLRVLEEAGLVRAEMVGRECLYEFQPKALDAAQDYLALVSRQWEQALTRLKAFVEKED